MADEWEFFDLDSAAFRRPAGHPGGVTDVLHGEKWVPYAGNRTNPVYYGDRIDDPLAKCGNGEDRCSAET